MADTKLSALTPLAALAADDLFYVVSDPAGSSVSAAVAAATLRTFVDAGATYSKVLAADGSGNYTTLPEAVAALEPGDHLFIKNGTYAGGVTIADANVTITGESRDGVVIQSPAPSSTPAITVSAAGVMLRDFMIDGRRDLQTTAGSGDAGLFYSGIHVEGAGVTISNVRVFETRGHGISAHENAHKGRVLNCVVENRATDGETPVAGAYSYGVAIYTSDRWVIAFNRITGWSQGVGLWWGASECVVAMNHIVDNYGYLDEAHTVTRSAIEDYGAENPNYRNLWFGNVIDGATSQCMEIAQGVVGGRYIGNICSNANKFEDSTQKGIGVTGQSDQPTYDILLDGNTLLGHGLDGAGSGVFIQAQGAVALINNTFRDLKYAADAQAVTVSGDDTVLIARNNVFSGCVGGFDLQRGKFCMIDGNTVTGHANNTITIMVRIGSKYVISNNYIDKTGVGGKGIQILSGAGDGHRITNNTIITTGAQCIDVRRANCEVAYNHLTSDYALGAILFEEATAVGNTIRHNVIDCNQARAINLSTSVSQNVVAENILVGASAAVYNGSGNATNQVVANHKSDAARMIAPKLLGAQTVGATQATIAHGLSYTPTEVLVTMTSAGQIWKSAASDATNIYLTADDADRTAEVSVR